MHSTSEKIKWEGTIVSIQPRTRVWRYVTDNRTHYHLGYNLFFEDHHNNKEPFTVAISEKQQSKGLFQIGDKLEGTAWTTKYPKREFADYYRAGSLKVLERAPEAHEVSQPPWILLPPPIKTYEDRGARMLSLSRWKRKCFQCIWANMANVEIQWDFDKDIKKYRFETFCYGPKSCKNYTMGKARAIPYKNRGSALDDGFLDEICTEGRGEEE